MLLCGSAQRGEREVQPDIGSCINSAKAWDQRRILLCAVHKSIKKTQCGVFPPKAKHYSPGVKVQVTFKKPGSKTYNKEWNSPWAEPIKNFKE